LETKRERDIFLTGALVILSGSLLKVEGLYDRNRQFPNLFGFIIAPAASGKGALRYAKILGDALHEKYIAAYESQKKITAKRWRIITGPLQISEKEKLPPILRSQNL